MKKKGLSFVGAKWITYLMFLGRERNTSDVVKALRRNRIVQNGDVIYLYVNELEKMGFIETVRVLPRPGPPKIRKVKDLAPISSVASYYRQCWDVDRKDDKGFTEEEKATFQDLFEKISPFLDSFPEYLMWRLKIARKSVRKVEWYETLSVFLDFCIKLIDVCWPVGRYNMTKDEDVRRHLEEGMVIAVEESDSPSLVAAMHLAHDPYRYVRDAYAEKRVSLSDLVALASFSTHGPTDIYFKGSFYQKLYLLERSLRVPISAHTFLQEIETIRTAVWQQKILPVSVEALYHAIHWKAQEEEWKILNLASREARQRFEEDPYALLGREVQECYDKRSAKQALKQIIEVADLDITEDELERTLVDYAACQYLQTYIGLHCRSSGLKLKNGD